MLPFQTPALIKHSDSQNQPKVFGLELGMSRNDVIKAIGTPETKKIEQISDTENHKIQNETWFYKGFRIKFQNLTKRDSIELCCIIVLSKEIPLEFDIKVGSSYQKAKSKLMNNFKIYSEENDSVQFEFKYGKFMGGIIELGSKNGLIDKIKVCRNDD